MSFWVRATKGAVIRPFGLATGSPTGSSAPTTRAASLPLVIGSEFASELPLPSNGSRVDINVAGQTAPWPGRR
jgi:hypothetical protein